MPHPPRISGRLSTAVGRGSRSPPRVELVGLRPRLSPSFSTRGPVVPPRSARARARRHTSFAAALVSGGKGPRWQATPGRDRAPGRSGGAETASPGPRRPVRRPLPAFGRPSGDYRYKRGLRAASNLQVPFKPTGGPRRIAPKAPRRPLVDALVPLVDLVRCTDRDCPSLRGPASSQRQSPWPGANIRGSPIRLADEPGRPGHVRRGAGRRGMRRAPPSTTSLSFEEQRGGFLNIFFRNVRHPCRDAWVATVTRRSNVRSERETRGHGPSLDLREP